jgi:hypothetical protein
VLVCGMMGFTGNRSNHTNGGRWVCSSWSMCPSLESTIFCSAVLCGDKRDRFLGGSCRGVITEGYARFIEVLVELVLKSGCL